MNTHASAVAARLFRRGLPANSFAGLALMVLHDAAHARYEGAADDAASSAMLWLPIFAAAAAGQKWGATAAWVAGLVSLGGILMYPTFFAVATALAIGVLVLAAMPRWAQIASVAVIAVLWYNRST